MLSSGVLFSALRERDQACPPAPSQITLCSRNIDPTIPLEREKGEQDCHKRRKSTPKDVAFGLRWYSGFREENVYTLLESYIRRAFIFCPLLCGGVLPLPLLPLGWVHWMTLRLCSSGVLSLEALSLSAAPFRPKGPKLLAVLLIWWLCSLLKRSIISVPGPFRSKLDIWVNVGTNRLRAGSESHVIAAKMPSSSLSSLNSAVWGEIRSLQLFFCYYCPVSTWACFPPSPVTGNCSADVTWVWDFYTTKPVLLCQAQSWISTADVCLRVCIPAVVLLILSCVYSHVSTSTCHVSALTFSKHSFG